MTTQQQKSAGQQTEQKQDSPLAVMGAKSMNEAATATQHVKPIISFYTKANNDWVFNFSGMLAYNLLLSIFPIAVAILSITGIIVGSSINSTIITNIQHVLPSSVSANIITNIVHQLNKNSGILGLIATILAIFFGSRLFLVIEACLDIIYHVRPRTFIRQNIMAILMLLLFIILIPIMIFASSGPSLILGLLQRTPLHNIPGITIAVSLGGPIGGFLAAFILFEAIYIVVPNQHISFKHSWLGALIAALALEVYLILFPYYIRYSLSGYVGQVGFAIILLVFFYYFAFILLLGAEINAFFLEGVRPLPNDLATFATTLGGELNKDRPAAESPSHQDARPTKEADTAHAKEVVTEHNASASHTGTQQSSAGTQKQNNGQQSKKANAATTHTETQREVQHTTSSRRSNMSTQLLTIAEVIIGSTIAFVVEVLRLRRRGPIG